MGVLYKTVLTNLCLCCAIANNINAFVDQRSRIATILKHTRSRPPTVLCTPYSERNDNSAEDTGSEKENNDPDGVPLFDTNDRATLFGLEPNAEFDPIDNPGLQFTGPLIMFLSIYVTLSLIFAGDGEELVLFDNIQ